MKHLRRWINKHSSIVTVISVAVLILALGWIVQEVRFRWNRSAVIPDAWFYDLNTGQLFRAKSNGLPPIAAPSGPLPNGEHAGVRAKVFACGDCSDPSNRFIGWLEKLTPEVKYAITDEHAGEWEDSELRIPSQVKPGFVDVWSLSCRRDVVGFRFHFLRCEGPVLDEEKRAVGL